MNASKYSQDSSVQYVQGFRKHTLGPSHLVEAKDDAFFMQHFADQVPSFGWNVIVSFAKDLFPKTED